MVIDSEDEEDPTGIESLRRENQHLQAELEKMEEKALHLARTLWMVHGVVKPLIDRTAEAAVLCKDATKGDGSLEKMREYYKEHGAKIQRIITPILPELRHNGRFQSW